MRLYKGNATAIARSSPNAIYSRSLATFNADASFAHNAAPGFIELFSLQSRMAYRIAEARELG
jgi:argininosuccinate synthase